MRDEEDIIRQNILYHLRMGVDFVIATDNKSVDGTVDILREFESQGVLYLIREEQDNYAQSIWVSRMVHLAKERFNANWVINNDADEFWWPTSANSLKEYLSSVPVDVQALKVKATNFIPRHETSNKYFLDTMDIRERDSLNLLGLPLLSKVFHRAYPNIEVGQGNHWVSLGGTHLPASNIDDIVIFHFPIRTYKQFENKIKKGGEAYKNNTELPKNYGCTWRQLYEKYLLGQLKNYFDEKVLTKEVIMDRLHKGELIHDARLRQFFSKHIDYRKDYLI